MPGEDEYNDPNDFELFVLGKLSTDKRDSYEHGRPPTEDPTSPASAYGPQAGQSRPPSAEPDEPAAAPAPPAPPAKPQAKVKANGVEGPIGPIGFIRS
jgi:hypothetical protein